MKEGKEIEKIEERKDNVEKNSNSIPKIKYPYEPDKIFGREINQSAGEIDNMIDLIEDSPEYPLKDFECSTDEIFAIVQLYVDINDYREKNGEINTEAYFKAINETFTDKKILEIGPGAEGGNILGLKKLCNAINATIVEEGRYIYPYKDKSSLEVFKQEGIDTVFRQDYEDKKKFHDTLNEKGPFDIILSKRVFYDGDQGSIELTPDSKEVSDEALYWFHFYNQLLKKGGLAVHNLDLGILNCTAVLKNLIYPDKDKIKNIGISDIAKLKYVGNSYIFSVFIKE